MVGLILNIYIIERIRPMKFKYFLCTSLSALTIFSSSSCVFASSETKTSGVNDQQIKEAISYLQDKSDNKQLSEKLSFISEDKEKLADINSKIDKLLNKKSKKSKKSICAAIILWLFLGGFGAHDIYVGKIGSGIFKLIGFPILDVITLGIFVPVHTIWYLVDGIRIITGNYRDSKGRKIVS